MGLQTTMTTSLTGMTAAETTIDVVGNNVANANTVGFKESTVNFATQFLQTQSIGSAPTDGRGGTNPRQVGLGVKVAEITPDFTQGTVEISANPLDLAIQGDGFFMVQGSQGETFYTRNGQFKTNADNEVVTITGHRVLGFTANSDFELQTGALAPLRIPFGGAAVAQETENVVMTGNLSPTAEVGTDSEIIRSAVLGDGSRAAPTTAPTTLPVGRPNVDSVVGAADNDPGTFPAGSYRYKVVYIDSAGNIGPASEPTDPAIVAGTEGITLSGLTPPSDTVTYPTMHIYRNLVGSGDTYERVTSAPVASNLLTYPDNNATVPPGPALAESGLETNTYSYYITYFSQSNPTDESRPGAQFGPVVVDSINAPFVRLSNIPAPPSGSGYDRVRIYRNVATDSNAFYAVAEVNPSVSTSYIDSSADADIISTDPADQLDLDGPTIEPGTPLVDVRLRDGANYIQIFQPGTLSFAPLQGPNGSRTQLEGREFTITSTTQVQELITFMEQTMGIVESVDPSETTFPDVGSYGGSIVNGQLQFVANKGEENAISIDLSSFVLTPTATGIPQSVPLEFDSVQEANGEGSTAELQVYDSLGSLINVRVTSVLEQRDATGARFRWIATSADHDPNTGVSTVVGTGVITTDGNGKFLSTTEDQINIDRGDSPAASPLSVTLDFSQITGLETDTEWDVSQQDGLPAGTLTSFIISESGRMEGVFSNGSSRDLGQIVMARFANNGGLEQLGDNLFARGVNSGEPVTGEPGSQGIGDITAGAVELSNTDIGQNLIKLILASTQYRGGARVITAAQQLLDELLSLRR
jgi:flagellar hook protein FlgE